MLKFSPKLESYTRALSTSSFSTALVVSFCGWLQAQMHSALIHSARSYAACQMTTAHQRHPSPVPLVLETRSTQTTTHLGDIIQTVSRILSMLMYSQWYGLYLHPSSCQKEISVLALFFTTKLQRTTNEAISKEMQ